MATRIYKVNVPASQARTILVEANTPNGARNRIAADAIEVEVASAKDVIEAMRNGATVLEAHDEPEPSGDAGTPAAPAQAADPAPAAAQTGDAAEAASTGKGKGKGKA